VTTVDGGPTDAAGIVVRTAAASSTQGNPVVPTAEELRVAPDAGDVTAAHSSDVWI
jgi:hypothetical protein